MRSPLPSVSLGQLKQVLVYLPDRRFTHLAKAHLRLGGLTVEAVPVHAQLRLALADWIAHLGDYLTDQQTVALLTNYRKVLHEYAVFLEIALEEGKKIPGLTLTISDGRWVHTSASTLWFDLEGENEVAELPGPCATHIVCDVPVVYLRVRERLAKLGGLKDAASREFRGGTDQQARPG